MSHQSHYFADISSLGTSLNSIDSKSSALQADGDTLSQQLSDARTKLSAARAMAGCAASCAALDGTDIKMEANFSNVSG